MSASRERCRSSIRNWIHLSTSAPTRLENAARYATNASSIPTENEPVDDGGRAEVDDQQVLAAREERLRGADRDRQPLRDRRAVGGVDRRVHPPCLPRILVVEELDRRDRPHALDEHRLRPGGEDHLLLGCRPQRPVRAPADQRVEEGGRHRDERERRAVEEHQRQGAAAIRPSRSDSMKPVVRVRCSVASEPKRDTTSPTWRRSNHATGRRSRCANRLAFHCSDRCVDAWRMTSDRAPAIAAWIQQQQSEAQRQQEQEIAVARNDGAVDDPLHEEGRGQHDRLEREGEHQDLGEARPQAVLSGDQRGERQRRLPAPRRERSGWLQLERHAGEVPSGFRERQASIPARGIGDADLALRGARQHDEVVQVPVQDAGQAQRDEFVELQAQRAAGEVQAPRDGDQVPERRALARTWRSAGGVPRCRSRGRASRRSSPGTRARTRRPPPATGPPGDVRTRTKGATARPLFAGPSTSRPRREETARARPTPTPSAAQ